MPPTPNQLAELLARVATRDRAAFRQVYEATSSKLYGIVLRILRRRDIADEVVQEVYVKVWERAADFDPRVASPITWLAAIARNRALDEVRRRQAVSIEDTPEAMDVADGAPPALDRLTQTEDLRRLSECLKGIEEQKREMVLLAYYYGLSREEIAARYSSPVATIKTWLRRSLLQLRQCLGA